VSAAVSFEYSGSSGLSRRNALVVANALKEIAKTNGRLATQELADEFIDRSRPKSSLTHHLFEWDPKKQAETYLQGRAREIIAAVRIIWEDAPESPVRAFPVVITQGKRGPFPMERVLDDKVMTKALVEQAKQKAVQWAQRFSRLQHVSELRGVFRAVDKISKKKRQ
jgi:hypothetical protein